VADKYGIQLEVIKLWKPNYQLPDIKKYQGLIIMGGPMGVYENYPSEEEELELLKKADAEGIPIVGFCLGSQLLAHYLGAKVHKNIRNGKHTKEIGYYDIELTKEALQDPLLKSFKSPLKVLEWHGDAFDLPGEATLLATSPLCKNQAFRVRNLWGFLFHFEFTPEMMDRQIEVDREWIHKDFEMDEGKLKKEARRFNNLMERQVETLFKNFLAVINPKK